MKKFDVIFTILIVIVFALSGFTLGHPAPPEYKHVKCIGSIQQLYEGGPYKTIVMKNETPGSVVYIAPGSNVSAGNALGFSTALGALGYVSQDNAAAWYCVTSGAETIVSVLIFK